MERQKNFYISGPVFISRLERKNAVIYNLGDIHQPLEEQTECPVRANSLYIHQHLYKLFKTRESNHYNFYLETHCSYGDYFSSNIDTSIYINQVRKLFHDYMKEKNKKNVKLYAFDERLSNKNAFSYFAMSSLQLASVMNQILLYVSAVIVLYGIISYAIAKFKKSDDSESYSTVYGLVMSISLTYIVYYMFTHMMNRKHKEKFLRSHLEDKYTSIIYNSKHKHVSNEYKILITYLMNNQNHWEDFLCCTYIIDLWCIDNILTNSMSKDKKINIIYSGLSHSDHIMFFLINKYNFKVTHTSDNKNNILKNIMTIGASYDVEKFIKNSYKSYNKLSYVQCCDISKFPANEFHVNTINQSR